ncbi:MAG: trimeric intracellular cation channel family protein [Sphaerochaetaceae bacterium]
MDLEPLIMYGFDIFGTMIFAITGAVRGVRSRLDFLGVLVMACTVGVGGGILRDLLLGATPVNAYMDETYLIVCIITGIMVFFMAPKVVGRWQIITICDAIGLGVFTALGVAKGQQYGVSHIGVVLSGVFTAVGGGVIRDIMVGTIPVVLMSDFYATASLIGGVVYLLLYSTGIPLYICVPLCAIVVTGLRLLAIHFHIHLPVANSWATLPGDVDLNANRSMDVSPKKR